MAAEEIRVACFPFHESSGIGARTGKSALTLSPSDPGQESSRVT